MPSSSLDSGHCPQPCCVCPLTRYLEGRGHFSLLGVCWSIVFSEVTLLHVCTLCVLEGAHVTAHMSPLHALQAEVSLRESALLLPCGSRGIELKLSDLAASAFTCKTSLQAQDPDFNMKTGSRETQLKTTSSTTKTQILTSPQAHSLSHIPCRSTADPSFPQTYYHTLMPLTGGPPIPRSEGAPFYHLKAKQGDSCQSLSMRS